MKPIKRGGVYYAKWRCIPGYCFDHPSGNAQHYISLRSTSRLEAQERLDQLEKKLDQQRYRNALGLPPSTVGSAMSLGEYIKRYMEGSKGLKAESTREGEGWNLLTLVRGLGEDTKLSEITPDRLSLYRQARLQAVAPKTWNSHVAIVQSVFEWGVKQGWMASNPFRAFQKVAKAESSKDRYVNPGLILEAIKATPDPLWRHIMEFLYMTYCRGGELRRLKPEHVYRDRGYLEFPKPKERRVKRIPLTPDLLQVIDDAMALNPGGEYVFMEHGRPLTKEQLYWGVRKHAEKAVPGLKLGPHRFRHSGITDALGDGVALAGVQAIAGHSQLSTTQNYLHLPVAEAVSALRPLPSRLTSHSQGVRHETNEKSIA